MHIRRSLSALLALAAISLATTDTQAQSLSLSRLANPSPTETRMYVNLLGPDQRPIVGRAAADFKVDADGQPLGPAAALTTFEKSNEPLSLVLLSQTASVIGEAGFTEIRKGFRQLAQVAAAHPGSQVSVMTYATTSKRLLERGSPAAVDGVLSKLVADEKATEMHLLDALQAAIDLLSQPGTAAAKHIILVSDGIDVSQEPPRFFQLGHRAQAAGVVITVVGFNPIDASRLRNLAEISKRCYGTMRRASKPEDLAAQLAVVPEAIQQQYVLTSSPKFPADDEEHYLQVRAVVSGTEVFSNPIGVPPAAGSVSSSGKDRGPGHGKSHPPKGTKARPLPPT